MKTLTTWFVRSTFVVAAAFGAMLLLAASQAQAGGGCRGMPVTEGNQTTVTIEGTCFSPTIVRAPVGSAVTWANPVGGVPHTVTGANTSWGFYDEISPGSSVTYDFDTEGVYPYFCFLHPGMVGAVIVGDAPDVLADGERVSLTGGAQPSQLSAAATTRSGSGFDSLWLVVPLTAAAIALAGGGYALGTRRAKL